MQALSIAPCTLPPECETLRAEVRAFLAETHGRLPGPSKRVRNWSGADAEFSRKLGARGWIGMTWPKRYGGRERSALERYVVMEEMLSAGAPVGGALGGRAPERPAPDAPVARGAGAAHRAFDRAR